MICLHYDRYAKESSVTMTPKELGEFLSIEQNVTLDSQQLEALISEKEMIFSKRENVLTLSGKIVFLNYQYSFSKQLRACTLFFPRFYYYDYE